MTAPRPGDAFHLDLDGTVIAGRYIEVDPPPRLVIGWGRQGTGTATPAPASLRSRSPPRVTAQMWRSSSGLSAEEDASYGQLWERYLDRIAAAFAGAEPGALPGN
jgi:uncharacterized protein YndB with AHSA1/START domain